MTETSDADTRRDDQPVADATNPIQVTSQQNQRVVQLGLFNGPTVFSIRRPPAQASLRLAIRW